MVARLKEDYNKKIKLELMTELKCKNMMQVPKLQKITINSGVGEAVTNSSAIAEVVEVMTLIAGQKPSVNKSKKAVAGFKLREDLEIGVSVTLRGDRMWHFLDKLINVTLPRTKDFRGLSTKSFDGNGNYSLGIREHTIFPEIDTNKVQKLRGLQITMTIQSRSDADSRALLTKFGFPFAK